MLVIQLITITMRMHNRLMNASIILVGSRKTIYVNAIFLMVWVTLISKLLVIHKVIYKLSS